MWYRFSKLKWDFDRSIGIDYTYAYTNAETIKEAVKKRDDIAKKSLAFMREKSKNLKI